MRGEQEAMAQREKQGTKGGREKRAKFVQTEFCGTHSRQSDSLRLPVTNSLTSCEGTGCENVSEGFGNDCDCAS